MTEYRPIPEDRWDEFYRLLGEAFRPQDGPSESPDPEDRKTIGEDRAVFEDDEMATVCRHYYWPVRLRGEWVDAAGLSAVATPPEHRRRGLVGEMLAESLLEYREREVPLSVLWPFQRSFYAQFGWATACELATFEAPVEELSFAADARDCAFRRIDADDWERAHQSYAEHARQYTLAIDRPGGWWREQLFDSYGTDPFVYVAERDGESVGHVAYVIDDADDGRLLRTVDWSWTDRDAWRNLVRFVGDHDSQVGDARLYGAPGELRDLLDLVEDPSAVEFQVRTGPMVRAVDVADALEATPYPERVERRLTLSVADPLDETNEGRYVLDVAAGSGTCRRVEEDATSATDIHLGIGALLQAVVGYRPVEAIARVGDVEERREGALDDLAALFPPERVALRDGF